MQRSLSAPTATDGYKVGHAPLYPEGIEFLYSNGTFRTTQLFAESQSASSFFDNKVVWVGLQGALEELTDLWDETFFWCSRNTVCKRLQTKMDRYIGKGRVDIQRFYDLWELQELPIQVLALPEGTRVGANVPVYVIYNTDKRFAWLVNYLESVLSCLIWKPVTVATTAYEFKRVMTHYATATGVDMSFVAYQGHDFSFRGMAGPEDGARSSFGHLAVGFVGTDTLPAIDYAECYYGAKIEDELVGCSVVATEHSVATSNILLNAKRKALATSAVALEDYNQQDYEELLTAAEADFIKDTVTEKVSDGIISLVSDSFDFWRVLGIVVPSLKQEIIDRGDGGVFSKVVFRHDSGSPVYNLCGAKIWDLAKAMDIGPLQFVHSGGAKDNEYICKIEGDLVRLKFTSRVEYTITPVSKEPLTLPEKGIVEVLWEQFGGTINAAGFKELHQAVGTIYGDGITVKRCEEILTRLHAKGFASSAVVFGVGSFSYQFMTRDTLGFAIKATAMATAQDGVVPLYKKPKTEGNSFKKSAKGLLRVERHPETGDYTLIEDIKVDNLKHLDTLSGWLKPVFAKGDFNPDNRVSLQLLRTRLSN